MENEKQRNARHKGAALAAELHKYVEREFDAELAQHALLGAFDYFDTRTRFLRDPTRSWLEFSQLADPDNPEHLHDSEN